MYQRIIGQLRLSKKGLGLAAAVAAALGVIPAVASAGPTARSGDQTLSLKESLTPNTVKGGSRLAIHVDYESTLPNRHVPGPTKMIQLQLPVGSHINPNNYAICNYNSIATVPFSQIASTCPKDSVLGTGTFSADARPTLSQPVTGTLTLYNVKGQHNDVLFLGHTKFGYVDYLFIYSSPPDTNQGGKNYAFLTATENNNGPGLYALKTIDATLGQPKHKPYITNPTTCPKHGWYAGLYISSYGSEPPIEANTNIACKAPKKKHKKG